MKHIHRFFVSHPIIAGRQVCLGRADSFHACRVLRLKAGDGIEIAGSDGCVFSAEVKRVGELVEATALSETGGNSRGIELVVAQALPQGRKLDRVVEKLSEIGVARLVPLYTEKSVVRRAGGTDVKLGRWRRIAAAAARQSRRAAVMDVAEPVMIGEWVAEFPGAAIALSTEVTGSSLGEAVSGAELPMALIAGPEAGFSHAELILLKDAGACFATLGDQILRTETSALIAATIVMHRLGALG